jgi:1,4-dihydroxy-6-naphthoate synthase
MSKPMTIAFSPCPNDTFIFDALVNGKIDTGGQSFEVVLEDVQTLNEWALEGKYPISKISYGVWPQVQQQYRLLDAGGALGFGVGPLLIAKEPLSLEDIPSKRIALPGKNTTAHLLFSLAFPDAQNKSFGIFHEMEDAVLSGKVDAAVIIHENRFTYGAKGLVKLLDLGAYWETQLQCPVPLGGIVVRKDIPVEMDEQLNNWIRASIQHSWSAYPVLSAFVKNHAQEMSEEVMRQHINLYVNDYSLALGEAGKKAVAVLEATYERIAAA